jgi:hypothetical protein
LARHIALLNLNVLKGISVVTSTNCALRTVALASQFGASAQARSIAPELTK